MNVTALALGAAAEREQAARRIAGLEEKLEHFARISASAFRDIEHLTEQCAALRIEARAQARRAQLAVEQLQASRMELDELKTRIAMEISTATGAMTAIVDQAIGEGIIR